MAKIISTKSIALLQSKYSETSIIIQMYTAEHGRQSFIVPGARKAKARIRSSFFTPLSLLELEQYRNEKGGLQKIKDVGLLSPLSHIRMDIKKSSIAMFLSEFLMTVLREEERNVPLFDYLLNSIQLLDGLEKGVANFHLLFLIELTRFLGFYPHTNYTKATCLFDLQDGIFLPTKSAHSLPAHTSQLFGKLLQHNFRSMEDLHLNHNQRSILLSAIIEYYNWHIPGMKDLQSLDILSTVFS